MLEPLCVLTGRALTDELPSGESSPNRTDGFLREPERFPHASRQTPAPLPAGVFLRSPRGAQAISERSTPAMARAAAFADSGGVASPGRCRAGSVSDGGQLGN